MKLLISENEVKMMKKLLGLLSAVCAMVLCLCAAYASPLTGDTSNICLLYTSRCV